MKMSPFYAVLLLGTIFNPFTVQSACITPPSCEELGFTTDVSKCDGAALKCPWDTDKAACNEKNIEAPLLILYGDGNISKEIISDKVPIGVVFDENNQLAVALTDVNADGAAGNDITYWLTCYGCDISDLENCMDSDKVKISCGVDGRKNTDAILSSTCNGRPLAANACNQYEAVGCEKSYCKKTKWFLPSLKDLVTIFKHKKQLNTSLTLLNDFGANLIKDSTFNNTYFSSTEYYGNYAWHLNMSDGKIGSGSKEFTKGRVRPVIKYYY